MDQLHLIDMHCHLDRIAGGRALAHEAAARGIGFFCTTVTPDDAQTAARTFADCGNVRVGTGLHPWWLSDGSCGNADIERLERDARSARYLGEVGIDAGAKHRATLAEQADAFRRMARAAAAHPVAGCVVSIHAVRSASTVLDILEETGLVSSANCIMHWFSGTSDELARARRLGCLFSVNGRMLATKRGREYARAIEERQLLLETDAPPQLDAPYPLEEIERDLTATLDALSSLRGCRADELGPRIAERSRALLGM